MSHKPRLVQIRFVLPGRSCVKPLCIVHPGPMSSIEDEMAVAAKAALLAGARRKQLAQSIASTASSSGSSGKRTHENLNPTPSTHVTPDPKQICSSDPIPVEPTVLTFDVEDSQGDEAEIVELLTQRTLNLNEFSNPEDWPELRQRYSDDLVAQLCREKEQNGQTKPHPEFPNNPAMTLYYVWWEDTTQTADRYEQRQTAVHEAGFGGGDAGNGGSGGPSDPNGKGGGNPHSTPPPPTPPQPKPKKEKKPKTVNQMARAAVANANSNILEIAGLNVKLTKAGVSEIIRTALVKQLKESESELKRCKEALEDALASDTDLATPTQDLEGANKHFKEQIKHANMHLPKATPKAKGKSKAEAGKPAADA